MGDLEELLVALTVLGILLVFLGTMIIIWTELTSGVKIIETGVVFIVFFQSIRFLYNKKYNH